MRRSPWHDPPDKASKIAQLFGKRSFAIALTSSELWVVEVGGFGIQFPGLGPCSDVGRASGQLGPLREKGPFDWPLLVLMQPIAGGRSGKGDKVAEGHDAKSPAVQFLNFGADDQMVSMVTFFWGGLAT